MPPKRRRLWFRLLTATAMAVLSFGLEESGKLAYSQTSTAPTQRRGQRSPTPARSRKRVRWPSRNRSTRSAFPAELTRLATPGDNPQTPEKVALGEGCFSMDACRPTEPWRAVPVTSRTCFYRRPTQLDRGQGGVGQRNAPTVLNALYNKTSSGTAGHKRSSSRRRYRSSIQSKWVSIAWTLRGRDSRIEEYRHAFQQVFGRAPNGADLVRAIASTNGRRFHSTHPSTIS